MSKRVPTTFKSFGFTVKQVFRREGGHGSSTRPRLRVVPTQRAHRRSPDEARLRREAAALHRWSRSRA